MPNKLKNLNNLKHQLITLHIPFIKITHLPQKKQKNIHNPIIYIPINLKKTSNLPQTTNKSIILKIKLKKKLSYKKYQKYQFINPHHIITTLNFLIKHNT